jgi:glycosyltransferase involved in cell wall biosynthesis
MTMNENLVTKATTSVRTHVLQIVGNAIVGGMENCVARLVERLPRERYGVSVLAPFESPFTDRLREAGADVVTTSITDEPSWHSIQLTSALIQSRAVDVIQSHLPNAHVLAAIAGQLTGRPVLATVHGRAVTTIDIEVQRLAGSHLGVVCRHSYFQALAVGVDPRHVHFIPNGVDTEQFRPGAARVGALRVRFGIAAETPLVGFVGRLSVEKGPDLFLRAALSVRAQCPEAEFVLVGEGPMQKSLQTFTDRFGLAEVVHFAGAQDDMPRIFNELDVVVSSSQSEAMPLAVMEAMASGVPVIACKVGGIPDLVAHGVTGWLVDVGDCDGLATRVVELLEDEVGRLAMGGAARERAVARLSLDQSLDATTRLYAQLTEQPGEPRRVRTLYDAGRPVRTNGSAVKSPLRR